MTDSIGRVLAVIVLVGGLVWWGMTGDSVDSAQYEEPVEYSPLDAVIGQLSQKTQSAVVRVSAPKTQQLDPVKNKEFQGAIGRIENYVMNAISQVNRYINQAELQRKKLSEAMIRIHLKVNNRVDKLPEAIKGIDAESKKYIHFLKSIAPQLEGYLRTIKTCRERYNGEAKVFQACIKSMHKIQKKIEQMHAEAAVYEKRLNAIEDKVWSLYGQVLKNPVGMRRTHRFKRRNAE